MLFLLISMIITDHVIATHGGKEGESSKGESYCQELFI